MALFNVLPTSGLGLQPCCSALNTPKRNEHQRIKRTDVQFLSLGDPGALGHACFSALILPKHRSNHTTTQPPVLWASGLTFSSVLRSVATTGPLHLQLPLPGALFIQLISTDPSDDSTSVVSPFLASLARPNPTNSCVVVAVTATLLLIHFLCVIS